MELGFDPEAYWRQTPRLVLEAFEARARAAETERRRSLWLAHETARLHTFAVHSPNKLPTLASLLGEAPKAQSGEERRALMKGLAVRSAARAAREPGSPRRASGRASGR